jgi:hypothetical protein
LGNEERVDKGGEGARRPVDCAKKKSILPGDLKISEEILGARSGTGRHERHAVRFGGDVDKATGGLVKLGLRGKMKQIF